MIERQQYIVLRENELLTKITVEQIEEIEPLLDPTPLPADFAEVSPDMKRVRNFEDATGQ